MGFDKHQFRDLIERVLMEYDLYSQSAVNLMMGTAAQESRLGTYLRQIRGPAKGAFQIEPGTFEWLRKSYGKTYRFEARQAEELEWDLRLSILVCRLRYLIVPQALPDADDSEALGRYWKRHYNTHLGKGTVEEFVSSYLDYVE